ncbi:MAG: DUF2073 domain-containing protein [Candidatus Odinarchaeota archaeon]
MEEDMEKLYLDYLTRNSGKKMSPEEKCELVINRVRSGKVIVIEGGLSSHEEALLIQQSMNEIEKNIDGVERFVGVEIYSNSSNTGDRSLFKRTDNRVTVIAPACTEVSVRAF